MRIATTERVLLIDKPFARRSTYGSLGMSADFENWKSKLWVLGFEGGLHDTGSSIEALILQIIARTGV